jgi:LysM repeat protein
MALLVVIGISFTSGIILHANAMDNQEETMISEIKSVSVRICVEQGDTLWSIARTYRDGKIPTQEYIHAIQEANQLSDGKIHVGQVLFLP